MQKNNKNKRINDSIITNEIKKKKMYHCNTCNITFESIDEHIKNFHGDEIIEIENNDDSVEVEEEPLKLDQDSKSDTHGNKTEENLFEIDNYAYEYEIVNDSNEEDNDKNDESAKNENKYFCLKCNIALIDLNDAETHECKTVKESSLELLAGVATNSSFKSKPNSTSKILDKQKIISLKCEECGANFFSSKSLAIHRRVHNKTVIETVSDSSLKSKTITSIMPLQVPNKKTIVKNLQIPKNVTSNFNWNSNKDIEPSQEVRHFLCDICKMSFSSWNDLTLHSKEVHNQKSLILNKKPSQQARKVVQPFKCSLCDEVFKTKRSLIKHEKTHIMQINTDSNVYHCNICNTSFATLKSLKLHSKMHKTHNESPFDRVFLNENKMIEKYGHLSNQKFWCELCEKFYDTMFKDIHKKAHKENQPIVCTICNKRFDNEVEGKIHLKLHENQPQKRGVTKAEKAGIELPYACTYCGRQFSKPHEKVKHERIHTGEKPFKCYICGKCFRVSYCLILHIRTHINARPYVCAVCNKRFKAASVYTHHMASHSNERPYKCDQCSKCFKTAVSLSGHRKSHTKPFTCIDCNRPFSSLYAVKTHMETHKKLNTNLKHKCDICGAIYAKIFALRDHMKEQHNTILKDKTSDMDLTKLKNKTFNGIKGSSTSKISSLENNKAKKDDEINIKQDQNSSLSLSTPQRLSSLSPTPSFTMIINENGSESEGEEVTVIPQLNQICDNVQQQDEEVIAVEDIKNFDTEVIISDDWF